LKLHSYVVEHDYGFAPNPFYGVCTLATCKEFIRKYAAIGDYIIGTGCAKRKRRGYLVYFMRTEEIMTFDEYWLDHRFQCKRPNLRGSRMQAFGDNIYHTDVVTGGWAQANSVHSHRGGRPNILNITTDTKSSRVMISRHFTYWGGSGPLIPAGFRSFEGLDVCAKRYHKNRFPEHMATQFVAWLESLGAHGYQGEPLEWARI
jgi:hypothetical protein